MEIDDEGNVEPGPTVQGLYNIKLDPNQPTERSSGPENQRQPSNKVIEEINRRAVEHQQQPEPIKSSYRSNGQKIEMTEEKIPEVAVPKGPRFAPPPEPPNAPLSATEKAILEARAELEAKANPQAQVEAKQATELTPAQKAKIAFDQSMEEYEKQRQQSNAKITPEPPKEKEQSEYSKAELKYKQGLAAKTEIENKFLEEQRKLDIEKARAVETRTQNKFEQEGYAAKRAIEKEQATAQAKIPITQAQLELERLQAQEAIAEHPRGSQIGANQAQAKIYQTTQAKEEARRQLADDRYKNSLIGKLEANTSFSKLTEGLQDSATQAAQAGIKPDMPNLLGQIVPAQNQAVSPVQPQVQDSPYVQQAKAVGGSYEKDWTPTLAHVGGGGVMPDETGGDQTLAKIGAARPLQQLQG